MKNEPFFTLDADRKANAILVKREFLADLSSVWAAWSQRALLDQWWAGDGWISTTNSMAFKEGGRRHYQMKGPDGEELWGLTSYDNITLHTSFSGKDCFADEHAKVNTAYPQSTYSIKFYTKGDKTLIEHVTVYDSLKALEDSLQYGFKEGTIGAYSRLDELLRFR